MVCCVDDLEIRSATTRSKKTKGVEGTETQTIRRLNNVYVCMYTSNTTLGFLLNILLSIKPRPSTKFKTNAAQRD